MNMGQHTSSKLGKTYVKAVYCHPAYLTYIQSTLGFPDSSVGKESTCNVVDAGSIPGLGKSPGEGKGYPLQYSGVAKSWTQLSDFNFHCVHHYYFYFKDSPCAFSILSHLSLPTPFPPPPQKKNPGQLCFIINTVLGMRK